MTRKRCPGCGKEMLVSSEKQKACYECRRKRMIDDAREYKHRMARQKALMTCSMKELQEEINRRNAGHN